MAANNSRPVVGGSPRTPRPRRERPARPATPIREWRSGPGYFVKLALMAIINALGLYFVWAAYGTKSWALFGVGIFALIVANVVYFSRKLVPMKYLAPGLAFLLLFQIFTMFYTGYVAFTNYGTGHNVTKSQAIDALLIQNERRVEGSTTYQLSVLRNDGELAFAITDGDFVQVGSLDSPLEDVTDATITEGKVSAVPGWEVIPRTQLLTDAVLAEQVTQMRVPVSDEAEDGSIRTREGSTGNIYRSVLRYEEDTDSMLNVDTQVRYYAGEDGTFRSEEGERLTVGWRVHVGFDNFARAFTDNNYAGPLAKITVWTFAFAIITVLTSFFLGLILAVVFNDRRMKGQKVIRSFFLLPYAFPAFMSGLLWRGMLNSDPDYGIINHLFFFDTYIQWLSDPWLAKLAIIMVNLWLSFPYWFLVCVGALQSVPEDIQESARIDGAGRLRIWRSITLPILLVSTAPLLIASFAFNFNNFTIIYMLTNGGPRFADTSAALGHTDILISMIYRISGMTGEGVVDYGFASALSLIVFLLVGVVSALAFRQTRRLEEMM